MAAAAAAGLVFGCRISKTIHVTERKDTARLGQESVWDYPEVPRAEPSRRSAAGELFGAVLFTVQGGYRVIEKGYAPTYYISLKETRMELLVDSGRRRMCEHRGLLAFWSLTAGERTVHNVGWSVIEPKHGFEDLRDHIAFYPGALDACWLDGERVREVSGDESGGWVTSHVAGPFERGLPSSMQLGLDHPPDAAR